MKPWNAMFACLALAAFAPLSHAQSDPGLIGVGDWTGPLEIRFPNNPTENLPITIQVPSDGCFQSGPRIVPEATTIIREGNNVTVDFYANLMVCFSAGDPPGVWNFYQDLGTFAAGAYAVTARYHYVEDPDAQPFAVLTGNMEVFRGNAAPATLPTLSALTALLLVIALALVGLMRVRRRRLRS
jgi:hypothetical protein